MPFMASTGTKFHMNDNTVRVYKQLPRGICVDGVDVETLRYLRHVEAKRAPGETSQI
jgi:hypothetical protein